MLVALSRVAAGSMIERSSGLNGDICKRLRSSMNAEPAVMPQWHRVTLEREMRCPAEGARFKGKGKGGAAAQLV